MDAIWRALMSNNAVNSERRIVDLFDDTRFEDFSLCQGDMLLDYAKTNIDTAAKDLLVQLAREAGVETHRDAMFAGAHINATEDRAVLHTALRDRSKNPAHPEVRESLTRMAEFSNAIRKRNMSPANKGSITDVINIGIGGSDLGPHMATLALKPYHDGPRLHFVSNIDGAHIGDTLKGLDPATTLVIVASKTFTTTETMTNAATAKAWLGAYASSNMAAVSTALDKTAAFGIPAERVFGFADWVGGRYSLWGPIGLPIMLAIGPECFDGFLDGAYAMDQHFCTAKLAENMPVMLALTGIWHRNICDYATRAVLPYDQRLRRLPAYLQQLDMESNGKRVDIHGKALVKPSGPVVWGEPGTNGQHAFYQLLHQGTNIIPCEFLIAAKGHEPDLEHQHDLLKANCLAQSEALMTGRAHENPHRQFPGNRPSITIVYPKLTPYVLGQIIALFEHRVFVEGVIWGLNSFDQWGVELGKELATELLPLVKGADADARNGSTRGLLRALR